MENPGSWKRRLMLGIACGCLAAGVLEAQDRRSGTVLAVRLQPYCRVAVLDSTITAVNADRTEARVQTRFQYWVRTSARGGMGSLEISLPWQTLPAGTQWSSQTTLGTIGVSLATGANPADVSGEVARFGERATTPASGQAGQTEWVLTSPLPLPASFAPPKYSVSCR
jgi:hypothetical protein